MRMWKVPPKFLCRKHLLGEHVELHMFVGSHRKGTRLQTYIDYGQLDPRYVYERHEELVAEMIARGYNHKSPIDKIVCESIDKDYNYEGQLNVDHNILDLKTRCAECEERINEFSGSIKAAA